MTCRVGR